jgi:hypothetical protein
VERRITDREWDVSFRRLSRMDLFNEVVDKQRPAVCGT